MGNVCVHKGLPLGILNEEHCKPRDVLKTAKDFQNLNFILYHSGFRGFTPSRADETKSGNPQKIPWISDVLKMCKENPGVKNIYFELGFRTFFQTFLLMLATRADRCHCLNMPTADETRALNLQAYRRLKGSLGRRYGPGCFVAISAGQVIADAATFDDLRSRLAQIGEDPSRCLIVQADVDYPEEVVIFWLNGPS